MQEDSECFVAATQHASSRRHPSDGRLTFSSFWLYRVFSLLATGMMQHGTHLALGRSHYDGRGGVQDMFAAHDWLHEGFRILQVSLNTREGIVK